MSISILNGHCVGERLSMGAPDQLLLFEYAIPKIVLVKLQWGYPTTATPISVSSVLGPVPRCGAVAMGNATKAVLLSCMCWCLWHKA